MSLMDEIEPVRQTALTELRAAPDLAALEQARVNYLGSHGRFTALMKSLGALPKEDKPLAGKLINQILQVAQQQASPAALIGKTPLLQNSEELLQPDKLATHLQQTISSSGVFYESHVALWAAGKLPMT